MSCIFCDIVAGSAPSHTIWEDEKHVAFLSIYPNTQGFSVVIPKHHYSSYAFELPDTVLSDLVIAAKTVGRLLDQRLEDVGRTGMIFEGFGIDHVHAKLFPMHGTAHVVGWQRIDSSVDKFFERYEGYISSHDWRRADEAALARLAAIIRGNPT